MNLNIYAQNIIDHSKNPRNYGALEDAQYKYGESNYSCGDKISISYNLDKIGRVVDLKFEGSGCAISQAAMSMLSLFVVGKSRREILKLKFDDMRELLGVPISESRFKCAMLGLMALRNSLASSDVS